MLRMCRECNELVSTDAKTCPHCGVPRPTNTAHIEKSREGAKQAGLGCVLWILIFFAATLFGIYFND